jgi:hypothetical protein
MSPLTKFLSVSSLLLLAACGSVERPNANACWVNAAGGYKRCYNLLTDYDANGIRLPGAKPKDVPLSSIKELNGALTFDATSQKELKRFMDETRKEYHDLKERCGI